LMNGERIWRNPTEWNRIMSYQTKRFKALLKPRETMRSY
jgi:hypothetical protein